MNGSEVSGASMLAAFRSGDGIDPDRLTYHNLPAVAAEAYTAEYPLLHRFWEAAPGSLNEEHIARIAARGYFIRSAEQLHNATLERQPELSRKFTQHSVELYGAPLPDAAASLMQSQKASFLELGKDPNVSSKHLQNVLTVLDRENATQPVEETDKLVSTAREQMGAIFTERYGKVLQLFDVDRLNADDLSLDGIARLFNAGIRELASSDPAWDSWHAAVTNGVGMSIIHPLQQVAIGKRGNYQPERLKPLFAHEVLVHGLRAINAKQTGDVMLQEGLPGNLDAEEGIAIFMEYAVSGVLPDKIVDRYIDVELALGSPGFAPLTRQELHSFHTSRQIIRSQAAHKIPDEEAIAMKAWNHVDRIYRGSLGNDIVGVNTKDIAYYQGYLKIEQYINEQIRAGYPSDEVFNWIMCARFDPTDARHAVYVKEVVE